jgi:hypothetical protein
MKTSKLLTYILGLAAFISIYFYAGAQSTSVNQRPPKVVRRPCLVMWMVNPTTGEKTYLGVL